MQFEGDLVSGLLHQGVRRVRVAGWTSSSRSASGRLGAKLRPRGCCGGTESPLWSRQRRARQAAQSLLQRVGVVLLLEARKAAGD